MKEDIKEILAEFFNQVKKNDQKRKHFPSSYSGLKLKVGFGMGRIIKVPWIAFLGNNQTPQDGIFPVYYFFKEHYKLILAYGISEKTVPKLNWNIAPNTKTVEKYFKSFHIVPHRYHMSLVNEVYDVNEDLNWNKIESDLDSLIGKYKSVLPR